jgi:hypothetical protein
MKGFSSISRDRNLLNRLSIKHAYAALTSLSNVFAEDYFKRKDGAAKRPDSTKESKFFVKKF